MIAGFLVFFIFTNCESSDINSRNYLFAKNIEWQNRAITSLKFWKNIETYINIDHTQRLELRQLFRNEVKVSHNFKLQNNKTLNKDTLEIRILNSFKKYLANDEKFYKLLELKHRIDKGKLRDQ